MFKACVITASDKGSRGQRDDVSGSVISEILQDSGTFEIVDYKVLPDDFDAICSELIRMADELSADLILTTGGTGFSSRDVTPEATLAVTDKSVPGIPEAMRAYSMTITKRAMLSRAQAGIRVTKHESGAQRNTLIVNLPGSPKAVKESLDFILPSLIHGLDIMTGKDGECAAPPG